MVFDKFIKKLNWIDIKLIGILGIVIGFLLVKLIPSIITINIWWFIGPIVIVYLWIGYKIFVKKNKK